MQKGLRKLFGGMEIVYLVTVVVVIHCIYLLTLIEVHSIWKYTLKKLTKTYNNLTQTFKIHAS